MISSLSISVYRNYGEEEAEMKPVRPFLQMLTLWVVLFTISGCTHRHMTASTRECAAELISVSSTTIPADTGQLIVTLPSGSDVTRAEVYLFARTTAGWSLQSGPLPAMVGRNGFALPGEKREGDGRTPAGLFPLEFAFGYAPIITTKMPYRQATDDDLWVDDLHAPDYNQWVRRGQTTALSFEKMKLGDHRYRYGLVIGYNRHPVVPGLGSAIFIHLWLENGISTSGCVALAESDIVAILDWLDPEKKPMILMGDPRSLPMIPGWSGMTSPPVRCEGSVP
jgi:L,D-peptidoglycan transpeptidase YkuD (ErfK/YbiS/YcfS/YnhG family)